MAIGWVKLSPSSCHEVITSQALSSKLALRPVAAGKSMHKFGDFENVTGCEGRLDCVMQSVCVCVCVRVSVFREYRLRLCGVWRDCLYPSLSLPSNRARTKTWPVGPTKRSSRWQPSSRTRMNWRKHARRWYRWCWRALPTKPGSECPCNKDKLDDRHRISSPAKFNNQW